MIYLHVVAGGRTAHELHARPGVRIGERPGEDDTVVRPGLELLTDEVPGQDVIAGVAAVVIDVDPAGAELITVVAGPRRPSLDLKCRERGEGGRARGGGHGLRRRGVGQDFRYRPPRSQRWSRRLRPRPGRFLPPQSRTRRPRWWWSGWTRSRSRLAA